MKVKTIQKILSAILFLLSCNIALSQEQIGVAAAVNKNTVDLTPEERLLVEAGYKIIQNRTIETDEIGKAQMLLLDGTSFAIGPNSSVTLDKFIYNPETAEGSLEVSAKGLLRLVGGKVTKKTPALIKTSSAVVGIRGGITIVQTDEERVDAAFIFGEEMTVTPNLNPDARTSITQEGFVVSVENSTQDIQPAVPLTPENLEDFQGSFNSNSESNELDTETDTETQEAGIEEDNSEENNQPEVDEDSIEESGVQENSSDIEPEEILTADDIDTESSEILTEEDEEQEVYPECSWNNPCYISITDGDLDDPDTNNTDEGGSNIGFNVEDPEGNNQVRGHLLDWMMPSACDWYDICYYAYYYQATRDYFNQSGVGMQFTNISGMYNFRAALEEYGFEISDVTVINTPRTLGNDTRGDDDGIIEDGEDWEYDEETCIEWRIYSGGSYVVRVDGIPIVSTNPDRYVHYQDYSQMDAATECDNNDGQGDNNITMWGEGDFSDMDMVADEDNEIAMALALAYYLDVGNYQVKYSYDSQTVHTKMDEEIRRADVEEDGSNYKEIALEYLSDDNCSDNCDYIEMGYYTINVTADYPAACDFGNTEGSPCNEINVGEDCEDPSSSSCFEYTIDYCEDLGNQACQEFILACMKSHC